MKLSDSVKRMVRRLVPIVRLVAYGIRLRRDNKEAKRPRNAPPMDRAQWRRWYQANRRYQRRLRALRRATGRSLLPQYTSLPRWVVR